MNSCDPCIWNKVNESNEITIVFHIDDLMLAHINLFITTKYMNFLDEVYRTKDPLTITR